MRSRRDKNQVKELLSFKFLKEFIGVYGAFFFLLFPLYYRNNYVRIGEAKWLIYRNFTIFFKVFGFAVPSGLGVMTILFLWHMRDLNKTGGMESFWKKFSVTDICVAAYIIVCFIATLFTPFKKYVVMGSVGWHCGLLFQLSVVLLYFFISRYWRWDDIMFMAYLVASAVVYLLAVFHRFSIDPFKFYEGISDGEKTMFLTTMGQNTWYSSYIVVMFPLGLFTYWYVQKKAYRIFALLHLILGAMTIVTQDSDSAFMALFAIYCVLFAASFRENVRMIRLFESLAVMFVTWRVTGFLQLIFPKSVLTTGKIMLFCSQNPLMWIPCIAAIAIYVMLLRLDKAHKLDVTKYGWIFKVFMGFVIAGVVCLVLYIILNTTGALPEGMRSTNNYLYFNDGWGNHRGINWKVALQTYVRSAKQYPLTAIVGGGPDTYMESNLIYCKDAIMAYFEPKGVNALQSAHNEWLTELVWGGVLGFAAYVGIFVTACVRFYKASSKNPELLAVVMAIAGYMMHNFFCYQQVICTPTIFILMGAGECIVRLGELRLISDGG
ncbi:hypothetical protein SAMN06296386_101390 [Lachnospiraceae bacterium]|nr:hypothetical protein SAMN06296386_101390 [Lachnospiraceae bacterium]